MARGSTLKTALFGRRPVVFEGAEMAAFGPTGEILLGWEPYDCDLETNRLEAERQVYVDYVMVRTPRPDRVEVILRFHEDEGRYIHKGQWINVPKLGVVSI